MFASQRLSTQNWFYQTVNITQILKMVRVALVMTAISSLTLNTLKTNVLAQTTPSEINKVEVMAIPPRYGDQEQIKLKPGEKKQILLKVRNNSTVPISLHTFAQDMIVQDEMGTPIPVKDNTDNRWSLASWLTIAPNSHYLPPRTTSQFSVLIEVPQNALAGGHYAMILHQPQTSTNKNSTVDQQAVSAVNVQTGTLLYLTVDGVVNEDAFLHNLNIPHFSEFGPIPISFVVENRSDIHINPQVAIDIYNFLGRKEETITTGGQNIFPFTERSYQLEWAKIWGFGYYQAQITVSYGTQGQVLTSKLGFWLLPIRLILAVLVVIFSLIAIIIAIRQHLIAKQKQQLEKISKLEEKLEQLEHRQNNE